VVACDSDKPLRVPLSIEELRRCVVVPAASIGYGSGDGRRQNNYVVALDVQRFSSPSGILTTFNREDQNELLLEFFRKLNNNTRALIDNLVERGLDPAAPTPTGRRRTILCPIRTSSNGSASATR